MCVYSRIKKVQNTESLLKNFNCSVLLEEGVYEYFETILLKLNVYWHYAKVLEVVQHLCSSSCCARMEKNEYINICVTGFESIINAYFAINLFEK